MLAGHAADRGRARRLSLGAGWRSALAPRHRPAPAASCCGRRPRDGAVCGRAKSTGGPVAGASVAVRPGRPQVAGLPSRLAAVVSVTTPGSGRAGPTVRVRPCASGRAGPTVRVQPWVQPWVQPSVPPWVPPWSGRGSRRGPAARRRRRRVQGFRRRRRRGRQQARRVPGWWRAVPPPVASAQFLLPNTGESQHGTRTRAGASPDPDGADPAQPHALSTEGVGGLSRRPPEPQGRPGRVEVVLEVGS